MTTGGVFVGVFAPMGRNIAYHSITVPLNPALLGTEFYDQSLALHTSGAGETTAVDCFQF